MGSKFIVGILYALEKFDVDLFMRVDGDDYVNNNLAKYSMDSLNSVLKSPTVDGFIVDKGVQVEVGVNPNNEIEYGDAFLIRRFDASCGTCRIFKESTLKNKLLEIHPDILKNSQQWLRSYQDKDFFLPPEMSEWLDKMSKDEYAEEWHPVNILGRHIDQADYLNFIKLPFVGAAKACGHGNHDGPREGRIHKDKLLGKLPIQVLNSTFGLDETPEQLRAFLNYSMTALFRMRSMLKTTSRAVYSTLKNRLSMSSPN